MNRILIFLIATLISTTGYSQRMMLLGSAFSDGLEKYSHFGRVDTIIELNYKASVKNGEITKGYEDYGKARAVVVFDKHGIVRELQVYISEDIKGNTYKYQYDRKDRLSQRLVLNGESDTVHKITIDYKRKNLIEKAVYFDGQPEPTTKWIYDLDLKNNTAVEKRSFPYDAKVYSTYKLGQNKEVLNEEDDTYYVNYKYDSSDRLIDEEQFAALQIDDGNPIRPLYKTVYKYDQYSNVVRIEEITPRSQYFTKYEYTFDEQNNWIKRVEFVNDEPELITERKIVYR